MKNNIRNEQTYRQLGRYLSGECSRTEARAVEAWAQGNPERESLLVKPHPGGMPMRAGGSLKNCSNRFVNLQKKTHLQKAR